MGETGKLAYDDGTNVLVRCLSSEARSDKAVKFLTRFGESPARMAWIPKGQIAHLDEKKGELWIPMWLADKRGLKYE